MDWFFNFPDMSRSDLREFKKTVDFAFTDFSRTYGQAIEEFFEPLLMFLVWFEKLFINTPWPIIIFSILLLAWIGSRSILIVIGTFLSFMMIGYFGMWKNWIEKPQTYFYIAFLNINSWMWVLTCLGYGKKYLNIKSKLLAYCNQAVYPFYILHQTVIVIIGYYVVQTPDNTAFKYFFLLLVCFVICWMFYHLFIQHSNVLRFMFGMKTRTSKTKKDDEL